MAKEEAKVAPTIVESPKLEKVASIIETGEVKSIPKGILPEDGPGTYRVTLGEHTGEFQARDRNDAWAQFCDSIKQWPSPKRSDRKIERIG